MLSSPCVLLTATFDLHLVYKWQETKPKLMRPSSMRCCCTSMLDTQPVLDHGALVTASTLQNHVLPLLHTNNVHIGRIGLRTAHFKSLRSTVLSHSLALFLYLFTSALLRRVCNMCKSVIGLRCVLVNKAHYGSISPCVRFCTRGAV